jgi:hypothetical protein
MRQATYLQPIARRYSACSFFDDEIELAKLWSALGMSSVSERHLTSVVPSTIA